MTSRRQITVRTPGPLTTIQDAGRRGHRAAGVGVGGAADPLSLVVANLLVANAPAAAAIEATLLGPRLAFEAGAWIAVAGATAATTIHAPAGDALAVPGWHRAWVPAGATLVVGAAERGCRPIIAVDGGIDVRPVLGGRGTDLRGGFGGLDGRVLSAGDRLLLGPPALPPPDDPLRPISLPFTVGPEFRPDAAGAVRMLAGPEYDALDEGSRHALEAGTFVVALDSDRTGCRLAGAILRSPAAILSQPVVPGTIQLPPSGEPILLLADAPTTGGYPRIAVVAGVDLPRVAQARPGDRLRFSLVTLDEAVAAARARHRALARLRVALETRR